MNGKNMAGVILAAAALCLVALSTCRASDAPPAIFITSLQGGETGAFRFPTRDVDGFHELMTGKQDYNATSVGVLYLPAEATPENGAPVMVILHGSGGEWSGRGADQAQFLVRHGVGALVVDTFASRGLTRKDKYIPRLMRVNFPDQLTDAFAALEILGTHPRVDPDRIGVMGYSMGGISAILAAYEQIAAHCTGSGVRFALHVPFYAPCIIGLQGGRGTGAPIVGLWGAEDGTTPRPRCEEMISELRAAGSQVTEVWYPGAAHGWNGRNPMKYYEGISNFSPCRFVIRPDGTVVEQVAGLTSTTDRELIENAEQCVGFGYTIGRHEETYAKANQALLDAVSTYMPAR